MTSLILPPNIEGLTSLFLREQPELGALLGTPANAARVYSALPDGVTFPAMRLTVFDTILLTRRPLWLYEYRLQLDAWGGSKGDALRILGTAMAAMSQRMPGTHDTYDAVVTAVAFEGMRDLPDETYAPAKPRWLVTAIVTAHPLL